MFNSNEPIRIGTVVVSVLVALSTFFVMWGNGVDWRIAIGIAVAQAGGIELGGESVRQAMFGPRTVDDMIDAERVINDGS